MLRAGPLTFTLGLSGFTSSNWAQAVSFDLLLPRRAADAGAVEKVVAFLEKHWAAPAAAIAEATRLDAGAGDRGAPGGLPARALHVRRGARGVPLPAAHLGEPLDPSRFEFRNDRERRARDLCAEKGAVKIVTENRIHGRASSSSAR